MQGQKGSAAVWVIVAIVVILFGYYLYSGRSKYVVTTSNGTHTSAINLNGSLPDGATVTQLSNGWEKYTNPKYNFSINVPSNIVIFLNVRSSSAYSATLNQGDPSTHLLIALSDTKDPYHNDATQPGSNAVTIPVGATQFMLWDNSNLTSTNIAIEAE